MTRPSMVLRISGAPVTCGGRMDAPQAAQTKTKCNPPRRHSAAERIGPSTFGIGDRMKKPGYFPGTGGTNGFFFVSLDCTFKVGTHDWTLAPGASPMKSALLPALGSDPTEPGAEDPLATAGALGTTTDPGTLAAPGAPGAAGIPGAPGALGAPGAAGAPGAPTGEFSSI